MIVPGQPGVPAYSGNPLLTNWYDYNASTHAVTPKNVTYIIRTSDGQGYVKWKIDSYADGHFQVQWAYSGAGRKNF